MEHRLIQKSNDVLYPFKKEWYDNQQIFYHGTSSVHCESIERNGWSLNGQPYDMKDIKKICKIFEDIGWDGTPKNSGYSVLRAYSLGGGDHYLKKKPISFSQNYWTARNYSRNIGGETIHYLLLAIEDILYFVNNVDIQKQYKDGIVKKLKKYKDMQRICSNPEALDFEIDYYTKFLKNISNVFLENAKVSCLNILKKYENFKKIHYPVVYLIRAKTEWFEDYSPILDLKTLEIRSKTNIPPESIIARIDFPKGVEHMMVISNGPQATMWEKKSWNKRCQEFRMLEFQIE
jgi:hypothetical protein